MISEKEKRRTNKPKKAVKKEKAKFRLGREAEARLEALKRGGAGRGEAENQNKRV